MILLIVSQCFRRQNTLFHLRRPQLYSSLSSSTTISPLGNSFSLTFLVVDLTGDDTGTGTGFFCSTTAGDAGTAIDKLIESAKFKVQTEAALLRANVIKAATTTRYRTKKRKK